MPQATHFAVHARRPMTNRHEPQVTETSSQTGWGALLRADDLGLHANTELALQGYSSPLGAIAGIRSYTTLWVT